MSWAQLILSRRWIGQRDLVWAGFRCSRQLSKDKPHQPLFLSNRLWDADEEFEFSHAKLVLFQQRNSQIKKIANNRLFTVHHCSSLTMMSHFLAFTSKEPLYCQSRNPTTDIDETIMVRSCRECRTTVDKQEIVTTDPNLQFSHKHDLQEASGCSFI
jgi:hypothetical protein